MPIFYRREHVKTLLTPRKLILRTCVSLVLLAGVMAACTMIGSQPIQAAKMFDRQHGGRDYEIFVHVRVPRVFLAALVGAALASAGVVFQALLQNPLADPYILGISSGAGLGATIAASAGLDWTLWGRSPMAVCAFAGALATVWLVWWLGRLARGAGPTGLLLAGVVVNAFFGALIMFVTSLSGSRQVQTTIFWLMGNMTEETFPVLWISGGCIVASVAALYLLGPLLNAISFGRADARSLGINTSKVAMASFAIAAFVTAVAVSLSGLIGFVGLIVPHAVRLLVGPDHRQLLPISAAAGAMFLTAADTVARTAVAPAQLPVGVVTAIFGGPFFLLLLIRHAKKLWR